MGNKSAWEQFPCDQCGASLHYSPGASALTCSYCGHVNPIAEVDLRIPELDYQKTIQRLADQRTTETVVSVQCSDCGASFHLSPDTHADVCEFCGSGIVAETEQHRQLEPQGVLPFAITQSEADHAFQDWLKRLWFAPSKLKSHVKGQRNLTGIYQPYWTFDSQSGAVYQGERGTYYQVPQRVVVYVNGRQQVRTQMVTKVRWRSVSGKVQRLFDDVLILASRSLPEKITKRLRSWNLQALKHYDNAYLSGFKSEMYQGGPEQGFAEAYQVMEQVLRNDIVHDIGGDLQRITHMRSWHEDIRFKHILLPIWAAAYKFGGKSYRFIVNGQTGEVQGERPYSIWKIMFAVLGLILIALLFFTVMENIDQYQY